jgi:hypothetical protein
MEVKAPCILNFNTILMGVVGFTTQLRYFQKISPIVIGYYVEWCPPWSVRCGSEKFSCPRWELS